MLVCSASISTLWFVFCLYESGGPHGPRTQAHTRKDRRTDGRTVGWSDGRTVGHLDSRIGVADCTYESCLRHTSNSQGTSIRNKCYICICKNALVRPSTRPQIEFSLSQFKDSWTKSVTRNLGTQEAPRATQATQEAPWWCVYSSLQNTPPVGRHSYI